MNLIYIVYDNMHIYQSLRRSSKAYDDDTYERSSKRLDITCSQALHLVCCTTSNIRNCSFFRENNTYYRVQRKLAGRP